MPEEIIIRLTAQESVIIGHALELRVIQLQHDLRDAVQTDLAQDIRAELEAIDDLQKKLNHPIPFEWPEDRLSDLNPETFVAELKKRGYYVEKQN